MHPLENFSKQILLSRIYIEFSFQGTRRIVQFLEGIICLLNPYSSSYHTQSFQDRSILPQSGQL